MSKNHLPLDIDIKQEVDSSFDSSLDDSDETWLYSPEGENYGIIHEDLEAWLGGAVNKVNYRTRSALARQLEKKSSQHLHFKIQIVFRFNF
jgi:hypothetical protein